MASAAVVCGGCLSLLLFILQAVALGTHYWYVIETVVGTTKIAAGLFRICVELSLLGTSTSKCYTYSDYTTSANLLGFNYYAIVALSVIGCILLFCNVVVGIAGCASSRPGRPTVQNLSGIWFGAGGCIIAAVVWFYITQYEDSKTLLSLTSLFEISLGYSFYLAAVVGAGSIVAAIAMCIVASQMDVPQTVAPSVAPAGPQVFVMHSNVQQPGIQQAGVAGYPQPGYPQPGYP
ncbi:uncharacterized protein LOC132561236 [Ylistrum balloti]|uniref:uncharacterized protein LOC132561236 n=1 Tax=Ylistrum balloti TaxID=509963 RepID=UPI002905E6C5|nr:uncharacterized protein LOC132561236 [Ylistrum balloti]